ncbi:UvrD-helicase domain-containing protein [Labrys sedimenti]|uniref:UvrD-helicase domain-containing protein n=1 Tax=Labrys sedimenti TaxID=3106036 RepID=UPI002ACA97E9|nr:UvrD-helicase domain-containing protein [Labrys sp. ZIDIC5]MDZ5450481.1 UvrD-helicase domain-containing protein [Labrys sp. ZIDIC5]
MHDEADDDLAEVICSLQAASVVAAAGCGKTEQIVKAAARGGGRRLILTHTHAGVDALRKRLKDNGVSTTLFAIDTIAGWCLRYGSSYPARSGLTITEPKGEQDWASVYGSAIKLIASGAVSRVLRASYCGLFVDEYQDCGALQHNVVAALSSVLPVCVFGDPLQAIFDFNGQTPVDWQTEVFQRFPLVRTLSKPHRWHKHGNVEMADWLERARSALEAGQPLDFRQTPACVTWEWLPDQDGPRQGKIVGTCLSAMARDGNLVVIGDPINLAGRALIAKRLAKQGFSNIEPVECKSLYAAAKKLKANSGSKRFDGTLDMLEQCMSGVGRSDFVKAVASRKGGGTLGTAKFGPLIDIGLALQEGAGDDICLALIQGFSVRSTSYVFRREMLSAMQSAFRMKIAGESPDLLDAIWQVQNRIRHAGRHIAYRSVGSTLLVKGLEFANAVVVHSPNMNRKDWYVALTRATHTLMILAPQKKFTPPA